MKTGKSRLKANWERLVARVAEGYTEDVTERGELTALQMETVEIRHEIQEHCSESKRLRELTRSLRRDLVLGRAKAGESA